MALDRSNTEVVPGLFVGGRPLAYKGFDVVCCCEQEVPPDAVDGYEGVVVQVSMVDSHHFELDDVSVWSVAGRLAAAVQGGERVLVHCEGGRNRSGYVAARVLQVLGYDARAAIELLREKRGESMLNNKHFRWSLTR